MGYVHDGRTLLLIGVFLLIVALHYSYLVDGILKGPFGLYRQADFRVSVLVPDLVLVFIPPLALPLVLPLVPEAEVVLDVLEQGNKFG